MARTVISTGALPWSRRSSGVIVGVLALGLILMAFVPLPPVAFDMLVATNVMLAVFVFMVWPFIGRPVGLREVVLALLTLTAFRLVINVVSTRLILSHGSAVSGTGVDVGRLGNVAGNFIPGIAKFVMPGSFVVGLAMSAIVAMILYLVMKRGAGHDGPSGES